MEESQVGIVERLYKYYDRLTKLKETNLRDGEIAIYAFRCRDSIKQIFGKQSIIYREYLSKIRQYISEKSFIKNYDSLTGELNNIVETFKSLEEKYSKSKFLNTPISKNIFIIHGQMN